MLLLTQSHICNFVMLFMAASRGGGRSIPPVCHHHPHLCHLAYPMIGGNSHCISSDHWKTNAQAGVALGVLQSLIGFMMLQTASWPSSSKGWKKPTLPQSCSGSSFLQQLEEPSIAWSTVKPSGFAALRAAPQPRLFQ